MNGFAKILSLGMVWTAAVGIAGAQQPAPPASTPVTKPVDAGAQAEAGEPRADTSQPAPLPAPPPAPAAPAPKVRPAAAPKAPNAVDRLDLGAATVTGDREQPKVMYIVPWKKSDIGDMGGKPMNSLLDEALAPVDRDEFKREVAYFDAVKADTSQNHAANGAAKQVEK